MSSTRLILASASSYKRRLLRRLGVAFETYAADIDESSEPGESPTEAARRLAFAKARRVREEFPDAFVLGADQIIELDGVRLSKPGDRPGAVAQLGRLRGRTHTLLTTICLISRDGTALRDEVRFDMVMRPLEDREIGAYVDLDEPFDCAGSYRIEAGGIRLFRAMRGDDYTAIIGLPLTRVQRLLEESGWLAHASGAPPRPTRT